MADNKMDSENMEDFMSNLNDDAVSTDDLIEQMKSTDMPDEMREQLKEMMSQKAPKLFGIGTSGGPLIALIFIAIIFSVILFFGYKLYKSIKEKELKKEEKKKLKQMKKKK